MEFGIDGLWVDIGGRVEFGRNCGKERKELEGDWFGFGRDGDGDGDEFRGKMDFDKNGDRDCSSSLLLVVLFLVVFLVSHRL